MSLFVSPLPCVKKDSSFPEKQGKTKKETRVFENKTKKRSRSSSVKIATSIKKNLKRERENESKYSHM